MQKQLWPSSDQSPRQLMGRLDRIFCEINVALLAVAIGLAVLDFSCFAGLRVSAELARVQQRTMLEGTWPSNSGSMAPVWAKPNP